MAANRRQYQIAGQIRGCLSKALQYARDERLRGLTITSVVMSSDLREAKVYWVCSKEEKENLTAVVKSSKGYLKSYIAKNLNLRFTPNLNMFYDDTLDTTEEVEALISNLKET